MPFIENATEILDKAEASFVSLLTDAVKARSYGEVATIATMAESLAAVSRGQDGRRAQEPAPVEAVSGPSWMRRP
jgi:hypothetical protein